MASKTEFLLDAVKLIQPSVYFLRKRRLLWIGYQSVSCPLESQRNRQCRLRPTEHRESILSFREVCEIQPKRQNWKEFILFPGFENTCLDLADTPSHEKYDWITTWQEVENNSFSHLYENLPRCCKRKEIYLLLQVTVKMPPLSALLLNQQFSKQLALLLTFVLGYRKLFKCKLWWRSFSSLIMIFGDYKKKMASDSSFHILSFSLPVAAFSWGKAIAWYAFTRIRDTFLNGAVIYFAIAHLLFCFHAFSSCTSL